MSTLKEYKSFYREHEYGAAYHSADNVLNDFAVDGWRLITVAVVEGVYQRSRYEVFYLEREAKISEEPFP
jgi:hypothetical protein